MIDTPPAQSFFTRAALAGSHYVIIPIEVEAFASRGIRRVLETTRAMHGLVGRGSDVLGSVVTCWRTIPASQRDKWTQLQAELLAERVYLFGQAIPFDDRVDVAHLSTIRGTRRNIFGLGGQPRPAARAYLELLKHIKERVDHANQHSH